MPRVRRSVLHTVKCHFPCEWRYCGQIFDDLSNLQKHQLEHFKDLVRCEPSNSITCAICDAQLDATSFDAVERHSHYHAWTLSLRILGRQVQEKQDWPECLHTSVACNTVPDLPTEFDCAWQFCNFKTNDVFVFYDHVAQHPEEYTDSRYPPNTPLKCLWEGCNYVANWLKNLSCHLDAHTQRKHIACPTCGVLLTNRRKFEDHVKRQQVMIIEKPIGLNGVIKLHPSVQPVSCSRCHRLFATNRLLVAHMKRHINKIKCNFCDMTMWGKAELQRHILHRHSNQRPHPCGLCSYRGKTPNALRSHVDRVHSVKEVPATCPSPSLTVALLDVDVDAEDPYKPTTAMSLSVKGPLAAAGALPLLSSTQDNRTPLGTSNCLTSLSVNTSNAETSNGNSRRVIRCPYAECKFRTSKPSGYRVHVGRKHSAEPLPESSDLDRAHADWNPKHALYMCHLCSVTKRRGATLSRHLSRDHQLTRPPGHMRFTYTLCEDGNYRLQLTRLDTVPVAAALLGQMVVNSLLNSAATAAATSTPTSYS